MVARTLLVLCLAVAGAMAYDTSGRPNRVKLGKALSAEELLAAEFDGVQCRRTKNAKKGYFMAPVTEANEVGIRLEQCAQGGACHCEQVVVCDAGDTNCFVPIECKDRDRNKSCLKFKNCKPDTFTEAVAVTLRKCPGDPVDLQAPNADLDVLADSMKRALVEECGEKSCAFQTDKGADLIVLDHNTFYFNVQGSAARRNFERCLAKPRQVVAACKAFPGLIENSSTSSTTSTSTSTTTSTSTSTSTSTAACVEAFSEQTRNGIRYEASAATEITVNGTGTYISQGANIPNTGLSVEARLVQDIVGLLLGEGGLSVEGSIVSANIGIDAELTLELAAGNEVLGNYTVGLSDLPAGQPVPVSFAVPLSPGSAEGVFLSAHTRGNDVAVSLHSVRVCPQ